MGHAEERGNRSGPGLILSLLSDLRLYYRRFALVRSQSRKAVDISLKNGEYLLRGKLEMQTVTDIRVSVVTMCTDLRRSKDPTLHPFSINETQTRFRETRDVFLSAPVPRVCIISHSSASVSQSSELVDRIAGQVDVPRKVIRTELGYKSSILAPKFRRERHTVVSGGLNGFGPRSWNSGSSVERRTKRREKRVSSERPS